MSNFISNSRSFKPLFSFLDIDPNMELLNPSPIEPSNWNSQNFMNFPIDNFFTQLPELDENFPPIFHHDEKNVISLSQPILLDGNDFFHHSNKRKATEVSESNSENSLPVVSDNGNERKHSLGGRKRTKGSEKEVNKTKDVVHVRARRGQATDSHSIAERVRRGKINERLKRLQGIVPGCYKAMGMSPMLEEIINYVQSLQNQFLSMRLAAASTFYDINTETDAVETIQRAKAGKVQRVVRGGYEEVVSNQNGPFDLSFSSYYPSFQHNR
ncbi:hypothetical protein LguiB_022597 [Lonicera macranthoides]